MSPMVGAVEVVWAVAAHMPSGIGASSTLLLADLIVAVAFWREDSVPDLGRDEEEESILMCRYRTAERRLEMMDQRL